MGGTSGACAGEAPLHGPQGSRQARRAGAGCPTRETQSPDAEERDMDPIALLEKKWQHYEKNNFVMRDIIASKTKEADHEAAAGRVRGVMQSLQEKLQVQYA